MATSNNIISLRRHDLDNLRVFLTELVISHHTSIAYGGAGSWPFKSSCVSATQTASGALTIFNVFNQSFFMGLFFGISGRVSAQSLAKTDRSPEASRWGFVKSKLLRLGMPAVFYTVAVAPLVRTLALQNWSVATIRDCWADYFRGLRGVRGPVWYMVTLLGFDIAAALLKPSATQVADYSSNSKQPKIIDYRTVGRWGWPLVAATSFFVRLYYPVGAVFEEIFSVQPAYLAQYVFAYALGHLSFAYGESQPAPSSADTRPMGTKLENPPETGADVPLTRFSLSSAVSLSLLSLPLCFAPSILGGRPSNMSTVVSNLIGGWNLSALAYALWNELSFITVGPALIDYFKRWHSSPTMSSILRPRYSYAAFLAHGLVSSVIEVGVDQMMLSVPGLQATLFESFVWQNVGPIVMTTAVSLVNIFASFAAGKLLLEFVPGLNRII
jgi:glucans biosynthesis protein C